MAVKTVRKAERATYFTQRIGEEDEVSKEW